MPQKKTGKIIQMLSPENYIRKKARTLPVYECLVNKEWKEQGVAHVVIARNHTNGNITLCMYLVDLFCLGVKNTQYLFNIPIYEYEDKKVALEELELEPISYTLAHNLIFAGLEYATEYGFKPHKDFTSITQFMLEEDTEDVELIDIECGKDGKPFYVSGPFDDQTTINKILNQLEKTAGPGNYDYLMEVDEPEFNDEFDDMSIEEQQKLFQTLYNKRTDLTDEELDQLENLTDHVIDRITSPDLVDQYFEEYIDDFDFEITDDVFTEEMLGISNQKLSEKTRKLFTKISEVADDDPKKARELWTKFKKETPENPATYFLELIILKAEDNRKYEKKVKEYYSMYPDYPLLKIEMGINQFNEKSFDFENEIKTFSMKSLFAGRTKIHHTEAYHLITYLFLSIIPGANIDRIQGLYEASNTLDLTIVELNSIDQLMFLIKSMILTQILGED